MWALLRPARAHEWWEHKVAPIVATGYATACFAELSMLDAARAILLVSVALLLGAASVSLVNDLTDREADRRAGRADRLATRSTRTWLLVLGGIVAAGAALAALAWHDVTLTVALYAASYVAFGLYSIPPVRLKERSLAGPLADAAGAHLFPHLLMASAVLANADRALPAVWAIIVGTWALASGLRHALWHQLTDRDDDVRAGVRTFARAHPAGARTIGRVAFSVELLAFAVLVVTGKAAVALVLLPAYALLEAARVRRWGIRIVVVAPAPSYRLAMHDFYVVLYPLAFLAAATAQDTRAGLVLLAHLAVFPRTLLRVCGDVWVELRGAGSRLLARQSA